jgi:hypothetical protein
MNPIDADDVPDSSLWRDLRDNTAGWFVRVVVCIAIGIFLAGGALVSSYFLAALFPGLNRNFINYLGPGRYQGVRVAGGHPKESLVAATMMLAGAIWMASMLWLFFRGVRQRPFARPILLTMTLASLAIGGGIFADSSLRGDRELVIAGIVMVSVAIAILIWLQALRQLRTGRPLRHHQDHLLDIRCPECGYRMVGLHESRCPECGKLYTLDQLLARQNFARPETTALSRVTPPMPPPIPPAVPLRDAGPLTGQPA